MSLVFNTKTYTSDSFNSDSVGYIGASKTVSVKDDLILRRTAPKPVVTTSGVGRTSAKMTRTLTLTGAVEPTREAYLDIQVNIPVGASSSDIDALLNDMGALLSSASFKTHVKNQQINF
jgi:hypothetical protein